MAGIQEGVGLPGTAGEGAHPRGLIAQTPLGAGGRLAPGRARPQGATWGTQAHLGPLGCCSWEMGLWGGSPGSLVPGDMLPLARLLEVAGAPGASSDLGQNPRAGPKPGPHTSPSFSHRRGAGLGRRLTCRH